MFAMLPHLLYLFFCKQKETLSRLSISAVGFEPTPRVTLHSQKPETKQPLQQK